jgi:hypothetical protein
MAKPSLPKQDPAAFAFLIAMGLSVAVVGGCALSGFASGAMQDLLRNAGFGREVVIEAEQRRQGAALAKIEASLGLVRGQVASLQARAVEAQASRRDAEAAHDAAAAASPGTGTQGIEIAALRSSLDDQEERSRHAINAVNKRIDWLETLVYASDTTGSIQSPSSPTPGRRHGRQADGWFVLHAETGVAVISGKTGTIDVTPGFMIPQFPLASVVLTRLACLGHSAQ